MLFINSVPPYGYYIYNGECYLWKDGKLHKTAKAPGVDNKYACGWWSTEQEAKEFLEAYLKPKTKTVRMFEVKPCQKFIFGGWDMVKLDREAFVRIVLEYGSIAEKVMNSVSTTGILHYILPNEKVEVDE